MKKRNLAVGVVVGAAVTGLALNVTACGPQTVYGPPPEVSYDPSSDEPVDVYGPPIDDYEPESDLIEAVYGPPPEELESVQENFSGGN